MKRVSRFLRLSSADKGLLISAILLLGTIDLGLSLLPFPTLWRLVTRTRKNRVDFREVPSSFPNRAIWAVRVAGRTMLGATCLSQALALQELLAWRGHSSQVRIGVARGVGGRLEAHAWVEYQGLVILGGSGTKYYTPLPLW